MAENPFQALASDIGSKLRLEQAQLVNCMSVMNDVIRPALKDAREVIQHPRIIWKDGERPSIQVKGVYKNDLSYACMGDVLEVTQTRGGGDTSHSIPLEKVSKDLIVKEIGDFLREALEINT
ncbi:MAG: hypothetical protein ABIS20_03035 [Thermoanaerobaculia bacterium]